MCRSERKAKKGLAVCELLRDGGSLGEGDRDFLGGIRLLCDALGKLAKKDKGTRVFSDYALRRFANDRRPSQTRREKRNENHETHLFHLVEVCNLEFPRRQDARLLRNTRHVVTSLCDEVRIQSSLDRDQLRLLLALLSSEVAPVVFRDVWEGRVVRSDGRHVSPSGFVVEGEEEET